MLDYSLVLKVPSKPQFIKFSTVSDYIGFRAVICYRMRWKSMEYKRIKHPLVPSNKILKLNILTCQ